MQETEELLRARLNSETGRLRWPELERYYARGVVVRVDPALDLVEVAVRMVRDDKAAVMGWMQAGQLARATDAEAEAWRGSGREFWAVVTAPWVLIQVIGAQG